MGHLLLFINYSGQLQTQRLEADSSFNTTSICRVMAAHHFNYFDSIRPSLAHQTSVEIALNLATDMGPFLPPSLSF